MYLNFKNLYAEYGLDLTREFEGMTDTLDKLHAQGKKLGIMSNKFEGGVKEVEAKFFPGLFDASHGETVSPRKPRARWAAFVCEGNGCRSFPLRLFRRFGK